MLTMHSPYYYYNVSAVITYYYYYCDESNANESLTSASGSAHATL